MARRSASSYFSAPVVVGFVGIGLLVVWMVTSSSTVPVLDFSHAEKSEEEQSINRNDNQQTENSTPDSPKEVTKGDTKTITYQDTSNSDTQKNESLPEKLIENTDNENHEKISEESDEKRKESNDISKPETEIMGDRNDNGGDSKTKVGPDEESNSDSGENTPNNMQDQTEDEVEDKPETGNVGGGNGVGGDSKAADGPAEEVSSDSVENRIDSKAVDGPAEEVSSDSVENRIDSKAADGPAEEASSDSVENRIEGPSASGPVASDKSSSERNTSVEVEGQTEEMDYDKHSESSNVNGTNDQPKDQVVNEMLPDGAHSEILNETSTQNGVWSTQAAESKHENEAQQSSGIKNSDAYEYSWKSCNVTAGPDYIPCLDNLEAIRNLKNTKHYEHRERHCPEEGPTCLVPLPKGYRQPILWPQSREKIWYYNVPHTKLVEIKGHQNWVKVSGENLIFPGGGTQFKYGATHYIDFIEEILPDIAWGKHTRVVLDVGCGVASFGGFLFDKDVLTMSFAPKDEHEAQVQFALERGIPAILSVMGTKRLPFPGRVFDVIHCARCRVPWHIEGGKLLLELNRLLRPGGYFVWSATPVYQTKEEDVQIWKEMSTLLKNICWEVVTINKDKVNRVGVAIYRKPSSNDCYEKRQKKEPPFCQESDDPNAAWNVPLQECMHKVPIDTSERGSQWPEQWPQRMEKPPYWLSSTQLGVYGKAAPEDFSVDYEHWKRIISKSYLNGMGISWSSVRNVMDMRSVYGGFAAALKDLKVWVMNVVPVDSPDTLPIIYERGLFGIYHDWCESFSTYPRSYDLLHADQLFSKLKKRCKLAPVIAEVDRILRPGGKLIVRDDTEIINELENMAKSLHWEVRMIFSKGNQGLLCVVKTKWRPKEVETIISAIE